MTAAEQDLDRYYAICAALKAPNVIVDVIVDSVAAVIGAKG
jgi:hypothetical protein